MIHFLVTVTLTSDLVFRIIVSGSYHIHPSKIVHGLIREITCLDEVSN